LSEREKLLIEVDAESRRHGAATVLFHNAMAAKIGVSPSDLRCLSLLDAMGPMSAGELAQASGLSAAAITSLLDRLEAAELVVRNRDPRDRRRLLVSASPQARERIAPFYASMARSWQEVLAGFDDAELAVALRFLQRSGDMLRSELDKLRPGT
jgi:DNA-binding MarR family transcriptional regulator